MKIFKEAPHKTFINQNFVDIWFVILVVGILILGSSVFLASRSTFSKNLSTDNSTKNSSPVSSLQSSSSSSVGRNMVVDGIVFAENRTVIQNLKNANNLKTFAELIRVAGLESELENLSDLTIFVPTDDAFTNIKLNMNPSSLKSFVESHIVSSKISISTLKSEPPELTTLSNSKLKITIQDDKLKINQSEVLFADVPTKNGLIQIIDTTL